MGDNPLQLFDTTSTSVTGYKENEQQAKEAELLAMKKEKEAQTLLFKKEFDTWFPACSKDSTIKDLYSCPKGMRPAKVSHAEIPEYKEPSCRCISLKGTDPLAESTFLDRCVANKSGEFGCPCVTNSSCSSGNKCFQFENGIKRCVPSDSYKDGVLQYWRWQDLTRKNVAVSEMDCDVSDTPDANNCLELAALTNVSVQSMVGGNANQEDYTFVEPSAFLARDMNSTYSLGKNGRIYYRGDGDEGWKALTTQGTVKQFVITASRTTPRVNSIVAIQEDGKLQWCDFPCEGAWKDSPQELTYKKIGVMDGKLFGFDSTNTMYQFDFKSKDKFEWKKPGLLENKTIKMLSENFVLTDKGEIFRNATSEWEKTEGAEMDFIYRRRNSDLYAISKTGEIYRRRPDFTWKKAESTLANVTSVLETGDIVYAVTKSGSMYVSSDQNMSTWKLVDSFWKVKPLPLDSKGKYVGEAPYVIITLENPTRVGGISLDFKDKTQQAETVSVFFAPKVGDSFVEKKLDIVVPVSTGVPSKIRFPESSSAAKQIKIVFNDVYNPVKTSSGQPVSRGLVIKNIEVLAAPASKILDKEAEKKNGESVSPKTTTPKESAPSKPKVTPPSAEPSALESFYEKLTTTQKGLLFGGAGLFILIVILLIVVLILKLKSPSSSFSNSSAYGKYPPYSNPNRQ